MSLEKLKQAMQLLQECIDEYQGEESDDGEESQSEGGYEDSSSSMPSMGSDKIKMAAALMKRSK